MTGVGWAVLGAICLAALQFVAWALVQRFDEDPPRPPPKSTPVSHVRRVKDPT